LASCSVTSSERGVPLAVTATGRDGGVVLAADRPFGSVACSYRAAAQPVDSAKSYRMIWWAQCPDDARCTASVRYGDSSRLVTNDGPVPLAPGVCYTCLLSGDDGAGDVSFAVSADGSVNRCDPNATP
jgi:hypothetical protein